MFKKIITMILSFSYVSSCALANFETEYVSFYQEAIKRNCVVFPITAYFSKLEEEIAGYCIPEFGILINEKLWSSLGPFQKKELMFHELGHCVLGLDHSEPGLTTPAMHEEKEIKKNWSAWLDLLFADCMK